MNTNQLQILLKDLQALPKECEWVEFKVNNGNPEEIGEYISALSNSACCADQEYGYLVFGIENETHRLVGTNFKPLNEKIKGQELENYIAVLLDPRIDFNIFEFDIDGMHFSIFKIEAAANTPVSFKGAAFIRIGSYKKNLKEHPERARKIWNKKNQTPFERDIAIDSVSETDILNLIDYPKYFDLNNLPLPDNRTGIISRLAQEKIIYKEGMSHSITNLGALLYAKDINAFDNLSRKAIRLIIYNGINKTQTKKEQVGTKGYAIGFEKLIKYISDQLPTNEIIDKALRKQVTMYPLLAIRELVANAIIHQDFNVKGSSVMIEIFDNRIEFTNPGKPLIDPLRFVDHSPESRNEILASCLRRLNVCEERGSGIDKVVFECERYQLPAPEFIVGDNYTRVILYAHKSLRNMDKKEKMRACYLHSCLKYVSGEYMTNQSLRQRFGIEEHNYATASRIISDTIESDLIKDYDKESTSRKFAKYVPYWV